jgi:hypothetical protein
VSDDAKFFRAEDGRGGAHYDVVARDLEHARQILLDTHATFDTDYGRSAEHARGSFLIWTELTVERAAAIRIHDDDIPGPRTLLQYPAGAWFCSEF